MRRVWADGSAQVGADQRHAGDLHGALAMPLNHAARRLLADRSGLRDCDYFFIHHRVERCSGADGDCFWFRNCEADLARTLACQSSGGGQLAAEYGDETGSAVVRVIVKHMTASDCCRLFSGRIGKRTDSGESVFDVAGCELRFGEELRNGLQKI